MHNITKPDETQRFLKNTDTESSHCTICHTSYNRHNNGVNCTVCHSDDVHDIQVFAQNATYVDLNHNNPNPYRGNCTNCHQNATFFNTLKSNPKAGSYTGANPAQIKLPLNHSSDNGGQKWGSFWTTPGNACNYCHGSTLHQTSALGTVSTALGSDSLDAPIGTGTVCSSCHNSSDSDYGVVMMLLSSPPANIPGINYPSGGMDHTGYLTDANCKNCHGSNLITGDNMSMFAHNVAPASGGACDSCHKQPPDGASRYNTQGAHTIHANAHYGDVAITGCDYCHSTGGSHETGHPNTNDNASVVTNGSASIATYVMNPASGKDDTCSGVSCHSNGLSTGARVGTAI